jgi:hypothetical protein
MRCDYVDDDGCPRRYQCGAVYWAPTTWAELDPAIGGRCASEGQVCWYVIDKEGPPVSAIECAASGTWQSKSVCPEQAPMDGSPCSNNSLGCGYDSCPDTPGYELYAYCLGTAWLVTDSCATPSG